MRDYLVVECLTDRAARAAAEAHLLSETGWRKVAERRGFSIFLETERPPAYRHLPGVAGGLIGEVFDAAAAREGMGRQLDLLGFGTDAQEIAWKLTERAYGRYVAILDRGDGVASVLRDPLGEMEAVSWRRGPLRFIASRLVDIPAFLPAGLAIDWECVGQILRRKNLASHLCPLVGVQSIEPGILTLPDGSGVRLWSPTAISRREARRPEPSELRHVVDGVVSAYATGRDGLFCEISGGLDSAIVATSLARSGTQIAFGINHSFPQVEADERAFARLVADRIGAPLTIVDRKTLRLTPEKFVPAAGGTRPNYVGGDPDHDADLAQRLGAPGIEAMFTGRGGDAVFYQTPIPALAWDLLKGRAPGVPRLAGLQQMARRSGVTVWSLLDQARRPDLSIGGAGVSVFLTPAVLGAPLIDHPWLAQAQDLPAARRLHVLGLVNNLSAFRESQRHRVGDVFDPLLSQPVVEFCLRVPAARLAVGRFDRPFARAAFAERLPPEILNRRGKGNLSTFFARSLAQSLDVLRPWLLEGLLVSQGLVDAEALEDALSAERLIQVNLTSEIFILMLIEAWVRRWDETIRALASDPAFTARAA